MTNSDAGGYRLEIVHQARVAEVASLPGNSANETTVQYFHSIGSVEGRLEAASVRNQPYLRVYDAVHDKGVKCYFSGHPNGAGSQRAREARHCVGGGEIESTGQPRVDKGVQY